MGVEDVPFGSKLVALVKLPQNLRFGSEVVCALYIDMFGKTLYDIPKDLSAWVP